MVPMGFLEVQPVIRLRTSGPVMNGERACTGHSILSYGESKRSRLFTTGVGVSAVKKASLTCFVVAIRYFE